MLFKIKPKFKTRKDGQYIELNDKFLIYSDLHKHYLSYSNLSPISLDLRLDVANIVSPYGYNETVEIDKKSVRYEANCV